MGRYNEVRHALSRATPHRRCEFADATCGERMDMCLRTEAEEVLVDTETIPGFPLAYSTKPTDYIFLCEVHHRQYDGHGLPEDL